MSALRRFELLCPMLLLLAASCTSPDAEGRFDDFAERTADQRAGGTPQDTGVPVDMGDPVDLSEGAPDISGTFFLAGSTVVAPGSPLLLEVVITMSDDESMLDLSFQPLRTDTLPGSSDARPDARTPSGPPIVVTGAPYNSDGSFTITLGEIEIPGDANPISGSDIVADMTLVGSALSDDLFCGAIEGAVTSPLSLNLLGSTFGAIRTDDPIAAEAVARCP